jgi:peptidoglycan/xylan/chitin deacetylase (PgdA/CDA1 family)
MSPGTWASGYWSRAGERLVKEAARALFRRPLAMRSSVPLVSFTFDDFPRSAFLQAAPILMRYGVRGTYYVSLSFMGKESPLGTMFSLDDLKALLSEGHELGCHTFEHCDSWSTCPELYERAIIENQHALTAIVPGGSFQTFAYPISAPRPGVKRVAGRRFLCCRGGSRRRINVGTVDLNSLGTFFLEKGRGNASAVKALIDLNSTIRGWLIFATHDVCDKPSSHGCTPEFFDQVVRWALDSRARVLPVVEALESLRSNNGQ